MQIRQCVDVCVRENIYTHKGMTINDDLNIYAYAQRHADTRRDILDRLAQY